MFDRRQLAAIASAVLVLGASACSSSTADGANGSSERPQRLVFENVKPCELVPQDKLMQWQVDQPAEDGTSPTFNSPSCVFVSQKEKISMSLVLVADRGIDEFAASKGSEEVSAVKVAGFPGYQWWSPQAPGEQFCTVYVDADAGKVLMGSYNEEGREKTLGKEELCNRTKNLLETAIKTFNGTPS